MAITRLAAAHRLDDPEGGAALVYGGVMTRAEVRAMVVSSNRQGRSSAQTLEDLRLLAGLIGDWEGHGFNLIARPNFAGSQNLYLQLNQTHDSISIQPVGSAIPNRGFGQGDIELFGLTYLQKIKDAGHDGALHIEPGLWVTQPKTNYPPEEAPTGSQIVARMGSIPHGNAILAQGTATPFEGPPTLAAGGVPYAFSQFPSFNSTPFPIPPSRIPSAPPPPPAVNAAGTSEKENAIAAGVPPFQEYDLGTPAGATNPRTPFGTVPLEPDLPAAIDGVLMQDVIDDPITLLQAVIQRQVTEGHPFKGTVLNIASQASVTFLTQPNQPAGPTAVVTVTEGAGGVENIPFLLGGDPEGAKGPNADTATVYATFWIEEVSHPDPDRATFVQLQYAQMVVLNFAILTALPKEVLLGWPHITVATLRKPFG
jgi:hypothetical protein